MISVLLPTKDRPDFLPHAITSVLDQTYTDWELVIHDVGEVPAKVPTDPRIVLLHGDSKGPATDFQVCLDHASGALVTPLADDDRLTRWALATAVASIGDKDWLCGKTLLVRDGQPLCFRGGTADSIEFTRLGNYMLGGAIYWRKSLTDLLGGFDDQYDGAADFDLYKRFLNHSTPAVTHEVMYLYTDHDDTDTRRNMQRQADANKRINDQAI